GRSRAEHLRHLEPATDREVGADPVLGSLEPEVLAGSDADRGSGADLPPVEVDRAAGPRQGQDVIGACTNAQSAEGDLQTRSTLPVADEPVGEPGRTTVRGSGG